MKAVKQIYLDKGIELRIALGDITSAETDVIVNAANERLQHGAGVAGALVRRGGNAVQLESDQWVRDHGQVSHDNPALTSAGDLKAKAIIHVVGPRWGEGNEDHKLQVAVTAALTKATEQSFNSLSFPAISTGIFGFPMGRAARVMFAAISAYLETTPGTSLRRIDLVLFDQPAVDTFIKIMHELWPQEFSEA